MLPSPGNKGLRNSSPRQDNHSKERKTRSSASLGNTLALAQTVIDGKNNVV